MTNEVAYIPTLDEHDAQQSSAVSAYMKACKKTAAYVVMVPGVERNEPLVRVVLKHRKASTTVIVIVGQGGGIYSAKARSAGYVAESRAVADSFKQLIEAMQMPTYKAGYFEPEIRQKLDEILAAARTMSFDTRGGLNWAVSLEQRAAEKNVALAVHRVL